MAGGLCRAGRAGIGMIHHEAGVPDEQSGPGRTQGPDVSTRIGLRLGAVTQLLIRRAANVALHDPLTGRRPLPDRIADMCECSRSATAVSPSAGWTYAPCVAKNIFCRPPQGRDWGARRVPRRCEPVEKRSLVWRGIGVGIFSRPDTSQGAIGEGDRKGNAAKRPWSRASAMMSPLA